jgi:lysozyme family protein
MIHSLDLLCLLLTLLLTACSTQTNFEYAFRNLVVNEGGYVNDPDDPGGETNFGISSLTHPEIDKKNLTREEAQKIYYTQYWKKYKLHKIQNKEVASKVFDLIVHFGLAQAKQIIQRALSSVYQKPHLQDDYIDWHDTLKLINKAPSCEILLAALRSEQAGVYRMIAQKKEHMGKFLRGWQIRAYRQ